MTFASALGALERMATLSLDMHDQSTLLRSLDPKQRKILPIFRLFDTVTSAQIGKLFGFQSRTSTLLCKEWIETGFLEIVDPSKKRKQYKLSERYMSLL